MLAEMKLDFAPGQLARTFASIAHDLSAPSFVTLPLPREALRCLETVDCAEILRSATVVWRPAGQPTLLAGFGREASLLGGRESTLRDAAIALRQALALPRTGEAPAGAQPSFFGGARFSPGGMQDPAWDAFGGWRFALPRILIALNNGAAEGSVTLRLEPGTSAEAILARLAGTVGMRQAIDEHTPGPRSMSECDWCEAASTAIGEIEDGRYEKVVLARTVTIRRPGGIDEGTVLARIANRYRGCYLFKVAAGGGSWVGTTPELLCRVKDGAVGTVALAGSAPRGEDRESDDALAARLMGDPKEVHEHALVVRALREGLAPFCDELSIPEAPEILRVPNIQHLRTPIAGRLHCRADVVSVVAALHPSPAVGGWPRAQSLQAIERLEGMDRGWYAGPIGRVGLDGDGEFAVGLRSALIRGGTAQLYAGAGIVRGSDPAKEYAETETKLRPLREAIDGV